MSERCLTIIVAAMFLASANAVAEGVYAGIGLGAVQIEEEEIYDYSVSDFPFGYRIYAGFEPSRSLAFEAVFLRSDFTTQNGRPSDTRVRFSGVVAYGAASVPSGEKGRLMAKVGLFTGNREIKSVDRAIDSTTSGIALGASYAFNLTEHIAIRGDIDGFLLSDFDTLASLTIGIQLRFGE